MKVRHTIFVTLLLSIVSTGGYCCSCFEISTFCEAAAQYRESGIENMLLVRGKKFGEIRVDQYRTDMIFAIEESFVNPLGIKTVRFVSGNGADCGRNLEEYKRGDELIILAHLWQDTETGENLSQISICIPKPLEVWGNKVQGNIAPGISTMSLSRFRELGTCGTSTFAFRLGSHPGLQKISLHMLDGPTLPSTLSIYDYLGRLIYQEGFSFQSGTSKEIPMAAMPPGIYILGLSTGEERSIVRFLLS